MSLIPVHRVVRYHSGAVQSKQSLTQSVEAVTAISQTIRESGRQVRKEDDLLEVEVSLGMELWQLLYENLGILTRDLQRLFQVTIDSSASLSFDEIDLTDKVAALGLWPVDDLQYQVSEHISWITALRSHLGDRNCPIVQLMPDIQEAFPALAFSEEFPHCLGSFDGSPQDIIPTLVNCLSMLNDVMPQCMNAPSTKQALQHFSVRSGYETTMEGSAKRKSDLTFYFTNATGHRLAILCEPHMKLAASAQSGNSAYFFNRIYFSSANHAFLPGKVLVGHAGKHL